MTETYELGVYGACDGNILPTGCSGLAIVSRYPFQEVSLIKLASRIRILFVGSEYILVRVKNSVPNNIAREV
jgi:hypothetical protein